MTKVWKPRPAELKAIRAYAARAERKKPMGITLEIGERYNIDDPARPRNINIRLVSDHEDWDDSDLYDMVSWETFKKGVELTEDGRALVDFYVYSRNIREDYGDLLTNVQAHVATIDGKPQLAKLTGTGTAPEWIAVDWGKLQSHDDIVLEGRDAALNGAQLSDNPYEVGDLPWAAWRRGWARGAESR